MKTLSLPLLALGLSTLLGLPSSSAAKQDVSAVNTFPREPAFVYTNGRRTSSGFESSSLIVYQDGFVVATRVDEGAPPRTLTVDIGPLKARSWHRYLLSVGAGTLPDGPTPDPTGAGAATLTVLEPATTAQAHTFSFGPGDYPNVEGAIQAMFLRLNLF